jgi:hypothetical protein
MSKVLPETVGWRVHYGLFARQGFSAAAQALAAESHALLAHTRRDRSRRARLGTATAR